MKKIIRWQGIVIFLLLIGLIATLWILFVDRTAERTIEKGGTLIVGAKVELDKADVKLTPLGITLTRLQVTNPEKPMTNAVEVGRIAFLMDGMNALRRKTIIEEMSIEDVRLNTPRETSGALTAEEKAERAEILGAVTGLPSLVGVNVRDVFEKEKDALVSLALINETLGGTDELRAKWEQKVKEIQAAADVERYKKRIDDLKAKGEKGIIGGLLGGGKELFDLQKEVRADINTVTSAKKEFESDFAALKGAVTDVPAKVREDARRLVDKYSLSPGGLSNITQALFGPGIASKVKTFLKWRDRLSPFIERIKEQRKGKDVVKPLRARGMDVRYREDNPLPDFLVRLAHVSVHLPAGTFDGRMENITSDQDILGKPLTFAFAAENLKGLESAALEGTLNRVNPDQKKDLFNLKVRGYEAKEFVLSKSETLPVRMMEGLADLDVGVIIEGGRLSIKIGVMLDALKLNVDAKEDAGEIYRALRTAIMGVSGFNLSAEVTGTTDDFGVKIRSDLDDVLKGAVNELVSAQAARLDAELQRLIDEHIAGPLDKLTAGVKGLDVLGGELDKLQAQLSELLKLR